jgi:hypothetical protein
MALKKLTIKNNDSIYILFSFDFIKINYIFVYGTMHAANICIK